MPGVTYERLEEQTAHGPLVIHVVRTPRPGGLYSVLPVIAKDHVVGKETVTSMQQRLTDEATLVGVNADFYEVATGRPSGILMHDSTLVRPPTPDRASLGVTEDGQLDVRRVGFSATWRGAGQRHPLVDVNQTPGPDGASLFTSAWGASTPPVPGATVVLVAPLPIPSPNIDIAAPVTDLRRAGGAVAIPSDGAVLVARGAAADQVRAEVTVGSELVVNLVLRPEWPSVAQAVGGGPILVSEGKPVFRANEAFHVAQLARRAPRTAVGQTANGSLLLVTVDGRQAASVGVTNWELARMMTRLGAVTAMAMDSGGSSTLAFDGTPLNTPSGGRERPVADALMLAYEGVYVPTVAERTGPLTPSEIVAPIRLTYRVVRPSAVTVTLTAPDGSQPVAETIDRLPGTYAVFLPADPPESGDPGAAQGRWALEVSATDDLGRASRMSGSVLVNRTVAGLTTEPRRLFVPPGGRDAAITWTQTARGFVTVTLEGPGGAVVRTLAEQRFEPGPVSVTWNGLDRAGKRVPGRVYRVRVVSRNVLGVLDQVVKLPVAQTAG
jgi:exopolysaccharide biosynthesis protein